MRKVHGKLIALCAQLAILICLGTVNVKAGTIDFDDTGAGSISGIRYQSSGVLLFSQGTGGAVIASDRAPTDVYKYPNTPPNILCGGPQCANNIIITFVLPGTYTNGVTNRVSFYVSSIITEHGQTKSWVATAYDINGNPIATTRHQTKVATSTPVEFNVEGIHRIIFTPFGEIQGIDTLNFEPTTAPGRATKKIQPWSTVASAGTVDDSDLSIIDLNDPFVTLKSSAPLPSLGNVRYNIAPDQGILSSGCKVLRVNFRDDGDGATVKVVLKRMEMGTAGIFTLLTFNSDLYPTSPWFQAQITNCANVTFDFDKNVYWIEALISRRTSSGNPGLAAIQIVQPDE